MPAFYPLARKAVRKPVCANLASYTLKTRLHIRLALILPRYASPGHLVYRSVVLALVQQSSWLSVLSFAVLLLSALFFARAIAHQLLANFTRVLVRFARVGSYALVRLAQKLAVYNRDALIIQSIEWQERRLQQSFRKFDNALDSELSSFAGDQQQLRQHIASLEEDYAQSGSAPMPSPEWVQAVDAVSRLPGSAAPEILFKEVSIIAKAQQKEALKEFRWSVGLRHRILSAMQPRWRKCHDSLSRIEAKLDHLHQRAKQIDTNIDNYQRLQDFSPQQSQYSRQLAASMWLRFLVSGLGVAVVLIAAATSYWVIKMPLQVVVSSTVPGIPLVELAALLLLAVNLCAGAVICELTGLTRFLPLIQGGSVNARRQLLRLAIGGTVLLAITQALLAYSYAESALTVTTLVSATAAEATPLSVNAGVLIVAYTLLGLLLPPVLVFASIPAESFLRSVRLALGKVFEISCRAIAALLAVAATPVRASTPLLCNLYDLLIFMPLWLQAMLQQRSAAKIAPQAGIHSDNDETIPQEIHSANASRRAA